MNNDFNLDDFKGDFQQTEEKKVSSSEVKSMLNKSSITNAKYILFISIAEFVIGVLATIYIFIKDREPHDKSIKINIPTSNLQEVDNFVEYSHYFYILILIIAFLFIGVFYSKYKKLQINTSIKQFTNQILSFRKWANIFIYYNVITITIFWFAVTYFITNLLRDMMISQENPIGETEITGIYIGSFILYIFFAIFMFVYYRYLWGTFLRRMKKNQIELEKIEE